MSVGDEAIDDVGTDEPGTTGYKNLQCPPNLTFSHPCLIEAGTINSR